MTASPGGAASAQPAQLRARTLDVREGATGALIDVGGRTLVNFCSNDYLGLAASPVLRAAAEAALARHGVGAGSAALLGGWTMAHASFAKRIAQYLQRDRALLFSSGYLANLGTLSALADRHDAIFHDRLNHASLIDGVKLSGARSMRYRHADMEDLARRLADSPAAARRFIVTDGVFSMDGDCAPLPAIARLAREHDALLVCDDAHGFGVLGDGRGLAIEAGLSQADVPLLVVTFGKALGVSGAAVVGRDDLIEQLLQRARTFIYDTATPPLIPAACEAALDLLLQDASPVARLHANIACFRRALAAAGLESNSRTPIQPVVLGDDARALAAAAALNDAGYYVRAVRPPTVPEGTSRLRICLSAAHEDAQIEGLVTALKAVLAALPPAS